MESVIEKLKKFNQSFEELEKHKNEIRYVNMSNELDYYTDLNVMFAKKLNLADYKKVNTIDVLKTDLIKQISNNKTISDSDIDTIKLAVSNAEKLQKDKYKTEYNRLTNKKSLLNKDPEKNKQAIIDIETKLTELKKKYNKI